MRVRLHGPAGNFILVEGDNILGRGRDCLLTVDDPRLSRQHARFVQHGSVVRVEDLGSRNGVLLNGSRITAPTALKQGDVIICGPCRLTCDLDLPGRPASRQAASEAAAHPPYDTEPMEPAVMPDAPSRSRLVDLKIAAAVDTTRTGQAVTHNQDGPSASLFKPDEAPNAIVSALADRSSLPVSSSRSLPPLPNNSVPTTGILPHESNAAPISALQARPAPLATGRRRAAAALLDGASLFAVTLVIALPLAIAGYVIALHSAGAVVIDGLPRSGPVLGVAAAPWGELVSTLIQPGACARAIEMVGHLHHARDQAGFLVLFGTGTLVTLATVLITLLWTVAATVLHGGPRWHRRLGLEVVMAGDGSFPSWTRSSCRWLLVLLLWPFAPFFLVAGRRSPHDLISGCAVRVRPG